MNRKIEKVETIEEFLARGGQITVIPPNKEDCKEITVRSTSKVPHTAMHITEGALLWGEVKKRKKKAKYKGDISLLDPSLIELLKEKGVIDE